MKKIEICLHCNDDYLPTRRGVQKFCSKSCKSRYWYLKKNKQNKELSVYNQNSIAPQNLSIDKMSLAGVGNAAAGAAIVEVVKTVFTEAENKPATKKDIQELKSLLISGERYLLVNNIPNDGFGRRPYFDIETGNMVYFY
jgi:hypothetical protein